MATVLNRRYRLEQRLWSLDGVDVYLAFDAVLSRPVVARVPQLSLGGDAAFLNRFRDRARIASVLHHQNIVAVLETGEDQGLPYEIDEYVAGQHLRAIIDDEGPFVVDDVSALVDQIAAGLHYAHSRGIVHGLVEPSRILVDPSGLARLTEFGVQSGTPLESMTGGAPPATSRLASLGVHEPTFATEAIDLAALACIAYEMLTGIPPGGFELQHSGSGRNDSLRVIHPSEIDSRIPVQAGEVVMRSLGLPGYASHLDVDSFATSLRNWQYVDPAAFTPPETVQDRSIPQSNQHPVESTWPVSPGPSIESDSTPSSLDGRRDAQTSSRAVAALSLILAVLICAAIVVARDIESGTSAGETIDVPAELDALQQVAQSTSP